MGFTAVIFALFVVASLGGFDFRSNGAAAEGEAGGGDVPAQSAKGEKPQDPRSLSDEDWKQRLTPKQYRVCREADTERRFTGKYYKFHAAGVYKCVCCGAELFSSEAKFNSGTGWPSFHSALPGALEYKRDMSDGMDRTEVRCAKCSAHLGHVFDDGPKPTGMRFCINSVCLDFEPRRNETS